MGKCMEFNMVYILIALFFCCFFFLDFQLLLSGGLGSKRLKSDLNNVIRQDLQEILKTEERVNLKFGVLMVRRTVVSIKNYGQFRTS